MAWLSSNNTGIPITNTLTDAVTHWAVTQGTGAPATTKGHPATTYGAGCVVTGIPVTITLGAGVVGCACPPCAHSTVAPWCKIGPGISRYLC